MNKSPQIGLAMTTIKILFPRIALAACVGLAAASLYAHVGESHAESRALSFCAASQPGETAEKVISRLQQEHDQATAFRRENSLAVVYGKSSQYVCDIRFKGDQVATAAVTSLN